MCCKVCCLFYVLWGCKVASYLMFVFFFLMVFFLHSFIVFFLFSFPFKFFLIFIFFPSPLFFFPRCYFYLLSWSPFHFTYFLHPLLSLSWYFDIHFDALPYYFTMLWCFVSCFAISKICCFISWLVVLSCLGALFCTTPYCSISQPVTKNWVFFIECV